MGMFKSMTRHGFHTIKRIEEGALEIPKAMAKQLDPTIVLTVTVDPGNWNSVTYSWCQSY